MEVHHHPIAIGSPTERKKFTHYLWEFFMLFLAVTLGFLVENMREQYVEHLRTRDYIKSLYDDIRMDTATIQDTYEEKEWICKKYDSALSILDAKTEKNNNEFLYYIGQYLSYNDAFTIQDVTYQQLKNSGNFRYIQNISLYKKIADYYNLYTRYRSNEEGFFKETVNLAEIKLLLFNLKDLRSLENNDPQTFYDLTFPSGKKLEPIIEDPRGLKMFYLKISHEKERTIAAKNFLKWLKAAAIEIINEMKQEYNLK